MLGRKLKVKVLDGVVPAYAHEGDAGLDLRAAEGLSIPAHGHATVGTGIACEVPSGCVGLVFPRSGLACKSGVALRNCVGVIDSGYRGEIKATLTNDTDDPFVVEAGDRIAQMVVMPYVPCKVEQVEELSETERGDGGYGSTGVK
jgi:dUTP pyrophosphatase